MARSRNIKPGFFTNDELAECSPYARLLFAGLWTIADKEGRMEDRPKKVKALVLPFDNVDCDDLLSQLHDRNFIHRYQVDGASYIQICNWKKHQNPHCKEAASEIPEPKQDDGSTGEEQGKNGADTEEERGEDSQPIENKEAPEKHGASTVHEQGENTTNHADSLNLIPDSLNLIPSVNTQAAGATCSDESGATIHQMASRYAFEGSVVRLNQKDFDAWKALFSNIDLVAELTRLDMEFTREKPKSWFNTASAKLNYQNKNAYRAPAKRAVNESFATKDYGQTEMPSWATE
jgi:hypothetical protein